MSARTSRTQGSTAPHVAAEGDMIKRKERQKWAKDAAEAERDQLAQHLREVDQRLLQSSLRKEAERRKRSADAWDPTPKVRPMHGDIDISRAAKIPGPGAHSPRFAAIESFGTTFSRSTFEKNQRFDRDRLFGRAGETRGIADQPGPADHQYPLACLDSPRGKGTFHSQPGRSFGLPKELQGDKPPPDAHDMNKMVRHLKDLPAPDAYSPRNAAEKNKGFFIRPSKTLTPLEVEMQEAESKPGPGAYNPPLPAGRSTMIGGTGQIKSELDKVAALASQVPGPGQYPCHSQLRSTGAPKFGRGEVKSFIEQVMADSGKTPGPGGTLFVQPTFKEEQERRKYMQSVIHG